MLLMKHEGSHEPKRDKYVEAKKVMTLYEIACAHARVNERFIMMLGILMSYPCCAQLVGLIMQRKNEAKGAMY